MTSPLGHTFAFEHDRCGRVVAEVDPLGHRRSYRYDAEGRVTRIVEPTGEAWRFRYDEADRGEGNLLNAEHVKLPGGLDVVQRAPGVVVRPVGDGGFYLQLTEDIKTSASTGYTSSVNCCSLSCSRAPSPSRRTTGTRPISCSTPVTGQQRQGAECGRGLAARPANFRPGLCVSFGDQPHGCDDHGGIRRHRGVHWGNKAQHHPVPPAESSTLDNATEASAGSVCLVW